MVSKFNRRGLILGFAALALAACAGPAPTESVVSEATRAQISISAVNVDVSAIGPTTKGRQVPAAAVEAELTNSANALLRGRGAGNVPALATLTLTEVNIITIGQSMLVGGESVMKGTLTLSNARTGDIIIPPTEITSGGGGWVAGGVIAAATRDDPATELRQMSQEFAARAKILVFGQQ